MSKNLMICENADNSIRLTESENSNKKYIFEGPFSGPFGKKNRNSRIYTKEEYLKHLSYLRDDLRSGEPLLGELDHPEDRFEVKLKEASHKILDVWYDENANCIMGKIELLNTPNGKLAQSLVDQGIPLHISSRAAGTVNSDDTVSIQQIYTYDLVCKPGFAEAVLHRVNESASSVKYSEDVKDFLATCAKIDKNNKASEYGFLNESFSVAEISSDVRLRKEAKQLQENNNTNDMNNDINESYGKFTDITYWKGVICDAIKDGSITKGDEYVPYSEIIEYVRQNTITNINFPTDIIPADIMAAIKAAYSLASTNEATDISESGDDSDKENDEKKDDNEETDKESVEILDVKPEDEDGGEDEGVEIIDVKAEYEGDEKAEDSDEESDKDSEGGEEDEKIEDEGENDTTADENNDESEKTVECDSTPENDEMFQKKTESNTLNDEAKTDIDKHIKKADEILAKAKEAIKKKNEEKASRQCESVIMAQYPVSMCMNESNFAEFIALNESQKNNVVAYIRDNNVMDAKTLNECWKNGINYVENEPVWLKYAPSNYRSLYESSSEDVKNSLKTTASFLLFENKEDVINFWIQSGLQERKMNNVLNESFLNNMPKIAKPVETNNLPYSTDFINTIAEMASEYNN